MNSHDEPMCPKNKDGVEKQTPMMHRKFGVQMDQELADTAAIDYDQ